MPDKQEHWADSRGPDPVDETVKHTAEEKRMLWDQDCDNMRADSYAIRVPASALTFRRVQLVNAARADRWHGGDLRNWSGLEWAGAMCGEAGEAANVAKKLRRIELQLDGNAKSERPLESSTLVSALAEEIADTILYACLLAERYHIDLAAAVQAKFNKKSRDMGFPERL